MGVDCLIEELDWLSQILWGRWSSLSRPTSLIVRHKWCVRRCNHLTRAIFAIVFKVATEQRQPKA